MKPTKRGICIDNELANFVYELHRLTKTSENKMYLRMLQIARQDLAPFQGRALVAVLETSALNNWRTSFPFVCTAHGEVGPCQQRTRLKHGNL